MKMYNILDTNILNNNRNNSNVSDHLIIMVWTNKTHPSKVDTDVLK